MKARLLAKAIATSLLFASAVRTAHADTWVFRDTIRPHGHERSMKAKFADGRKCGAVGHEFSDAVLPTMQQCMLAHGWALDHIIPDAAPRYARHHTNQNEEDELAKRNEDASNDAERQRDEEARSDDFQRQIQDQINNDAAANAQANGQ